MAKIASVEIVIPIFNEEEELETSIYKLHKFLTSISRKFNSTITIADNASTDQSFEIAQELAQKFRNVRAVHLSQKGRGRAVKKVWNESAADILAYMDADLSTDLNSFQPLIHALQNGYDIAIGSRLLPHAKVSKRPLKREVLSRCYNLLIKIFFNTRFSDAQCGFKAINRRTVAGLLPHIRDNAWFFDSELLIVGEKLGYKIYEEPVQWIDNPGSTVRVLKTIYGDLEGMCRLFFQKPWENIGSSR